MNKNHETCGTFLQFYPMKFKSVEICKCGVTTCKNHGLMKTYFYDKKAYYVTKSTKNNQVLIFYFRL